MRYVLDLIHALKILVFFQKNTSDKGILGKQEHKKQAKMILF